MTGFWSCVSTCCVPLLVVAIALDPGFAPSQQQNQPKPEWTKPFRRALRYLY